MFKMEVKREQPINQIIPETQDDDFQVLKKLSVCQARTKPILRNRTVKIEKKETSSKNKKTTVKKRKVGFSPDLNSAKQKQVKQLPISNFFSNASKKSKDDCTINLESFNVASSIVCSTLGGHNKYINSDVSPIAKNLKLDNDDHKLDVSSFPETIDITGDFESKMSISPVIDRIVHEKSVNDVHSNQLITVSKKLKLVDIDPISVGPSIPEAVDVSELDFNSKMSISPVANKIVQDKSINSFNLNKPTTVNRKLKLHNIDSILNVPSVSTTVNTEELNFNSKMLISPVSHGVTEEKCIDKSDRYVNSNQLSDINRKLTSNDMDLTSIPSSIPETTDIAEFNFDSKISTLPSTPCVTKDEKCMDAATEAVPAKPNRDRSPSEIPYISDLDWETFGDDSLFYSQETLQKLSPMKDANDRNKESTHNSRSVPGNLKYRICSINRSNPNEVELSLEDFTKNSNIQNKCILQGFWTESVLSEGDVVSILSPFVNGTAIINDYSGFLVVNPDLLVSSTSVVSTLFCMRKAVLSHKYRQWESTNRNMMIGVLVHQLFQQAVNEHKYLDKEIEDILLRIMKYSENLILMSGQDQSEEEVYKDLMSYVSSISQWIEKYCAVEKPQRHHEDLHVTEVRDIEDNIWCPKYGLKGKIDLTLQVEFRNQNSQKLMPLELKTGIPSFSAEHIGQVNLYTLMMEDRTKERSDGLLLYLKGGPQMKQVPPDHNIQRGLIQLRNELAHYCFNWKAVKTKEENSDKSLSDNFCLPEPINNKRLCQRCNYILPCTLYQRAYTAKKLDSNHPMSNLVPSNTSHLEESHLQYFRHWSHLLNLESASATVEKCFWNEDPCEREKEGLCFSYMVLRDDISTQQEKEGDSYIHSFFRSRNSPINLEFCGLKAGDSIAISNQENNLEVALATGSIISVEADCVKVLIERDIQKLARYDGYIFRLDKILYNSAGNSSYKNLLKLMTQDTLATRLRQSIVDKRPPEFIPTMSKSVAIKARPYLKSLNKPQRKAVFKVLMAKDYALLKGMPGTGKTATIVALVRMLVQMGCSVLLTSHTHSAVDNILRKLLQFNCDFVRVGRTSRIHADIHPYSFQCLTKNMNSVQELSSFIHSKMVVASTCLGINHVIFETRKFDYCIVDEASQVIQSICLGPLFCADKFVLVGDPKQLPPVVINEQAKKGGMQESLFSRLETSSNCIELSLQYRMNREIMRVCNAFAYNNTMQCGSEEVASSILNMDITKLKDYCASEPKWLLTALDCQLNCSLMFLNTDDIPAPESRNSLGKVKNDIEVQLVGFLTNCLIKCGVSIQDIGVITPYRCQVDLITNYLSRMDILGIEVNTVDQYQGKDKEVIIISCVRSGYKVIEEDGNASIIVGDERRLNVAVSRAKKKLLIVGSKTTLSALDCFQRLFTFLQPTQVLNLPKNAQSTFVNATV